MAAGGHGVERTLALLFAGVLAFSLFSLYWEAAAKDAAPGSNSESSVSGAFPVTLVNLAVILEFLPLRGLGRFVPVSSLIMAAGFAVEAIGIALAIWARVHLGRY
jgi:hypothetical protein